MYVAPCKTSVVIQTLVPRLQRIFASTSNLWKQDISCVQSRIGDLWQSVSARTSRGITSISPTRTNSVGLKVFLSKTHSQLGKMHNIDGLQRISVVSFLLTQYFNQFCTLLSRRAAKARNNSDSLNSSARRTNSGLVTDRKFNASELQ